MKAIILGSGTSTGVPRVGNDWGLCDPEEPRNRRSRASVLVESDDGSRLLIDTSTDMRSQLLDNAIDRIDGVFWTHEHADHCHGIDDLRVLRYGRAGPIPGYAHSEIVRILRQRFGYVFAGQHGYPTIVSLESLDRLRICAGIGVSSVQMPHGHGDTTGFRFDCDGKSVVYATDFNAVTKPMVDAFYKCDVLITDCLRREPHPTHCHLEMALELSAATRARITVLTHLDKSMDYATLNREIPDGVFVAYDGMEIVA
ncbi:MAG: MBL fold metallo-hydrolase [Novosphingobium sp.]